MKNQTFTSLVWGRERALKSSCSVFVIALTALLCGSAQSLAQVPWSGVLRNAGGAPIADAKVTLTSEHEKGEARTDTNGRFAVQVPTGSYRVTVAAKDSKTADFAFGK